MAPTGAGFHLAVRMCESKVGEDNSFLIIILKKIEYLNMTDKKKRNKKNQMYLCRQPCVTYKKTFMISLSAYTCSALCEDKT